MTEEDWNTSLREQNFRRDAFKIFCELHSKKKRHLHFDEWYEKYRAEQEAELRHRQQWGLKDE